MNMSSDFRNDNAAQGSNKISGNKVKIEKSKLTVDFIPRATVTIKYKLTMK